MMQARLRMLGEKTPPREIKIKLPMVIGRGREADLTLAHSLVSRQHCELYEVEDTLCVRDLGSLNGTYVGNVRVTEAALELGDVLSIGAFRFEVIMPGAEKSSAASTPAAADEMTDEDDPFAAFVDADSPAENVVTRPAINNQPTEPEPVDVSSNGEHGIDPPPLALPDMGEEEPESLSGISAAALEEAAVEQSPVEELEDLVDELDELQDFAEPVAEAEAGDEALAAIDLIDDLPQPEEPAAALADDIEIEVEIEPEFDAEDEVEINAADSIDVADSVEVVDDSEVAVEAADEEMIEIDLVEDGEPPAPAAPAAETPPEPTSKPAESPDFGFLNGAEAEIELSADDEPADPGGASDEDLQKFFKGLK